MTYNEFKAELKAGLPRSLYIFAGEEEYLKETAAAQAKEKLVPSGMEDFNYRSWSELPDFAECNGFGKKPTGKSCFPNCPTTSASFFGRASSRREKRKPNRR